MEPLGRALYRGFRIDARSGRVPLRAHRFKP